MSGKLISKYIFMTKCVSAHPITIKSFLGARFTALGDHLPLQVWHFPRTVHSFLPPTAANPDANLYFLKESQVAVQLLGAITTGRTQSPFALSQVITLDLPVSLKC